MRAITLALLGRYFSYLSANTNNKYRNLKAIYYILSFICVLASIICIIVGW